MPRHLHLDYESFSEADLRDVGAYRYSYDSSTEILVAAMAIDDEEPMAWWQGMPDSELDKLERYWDALEDPSVLVYAHNAMMEMAMSQALMFKTWNIRCPDLSRFRCTMSLARRACLPNSLEKLAETLGLSAKKDNRGKALIKKFAQMQPAKKPTKKNPEGVPVRRIYPADEPEAFREFVEYCRQDVRVEQEVGRKLAYFDEPINNANYTLDAKINARGVAVNIPALQHTQRIIEEETAIVSARFRDLTGFEITQREKVLSWCNERGARLPDLQAGTIDDFLGQFEDDPQDPAIYEVIDALQMKQALSYAAPKKVAAMLACVGPHDNRIRGMLNHHGANTGRWTASLVQFQNMKRSTKTSEEAYKEICEGISREMLDLCYGDPLEIISLCIRHFVQDSRPINDADYAAIEARIVAWLAGEEDALRQYRAYDAAKTPEEKHALDPYRLLAMLIYGFDRVDQVEKFPHRHVGKHAKLGLGFGMGSSKFRVTVKAQGNYDLEAGLEDKAVTTFRSANKKIVSFWYDSERAAKRAILNKGKVFPAGKVAFKCEDISGIPFLLMKLPSGRKLAYPWPKIKDDRIHFFGNIKGTQWGDIATWGGSLVENATQAVAADVMAAGAHNCENEGYEIMTLIHDQALSYHQDGQTAEQFVQLLTDLPAWAEGLPIAAEGSLVPFYRKD
jgi:DNA polymerase